MSVVSRNLVEYSGICDCLPCLVDNYTNFKVDEFTSLPADKPLIKQISKVTAKAQIIDGRLVKSNLNNDSKGCLPNFKYICTALVAFKIEYTDLCDSNVYILNYESTITTFIPIYEGSKYCQNLIPSIYIDDLHVEILSCDSLMLNASGIIIIESN